MFRVCTLTTAAVAFLMVGSAGAQRTEQVLDRDFLVKTITCNHAEIKASEYVETRANDPKVKEFASKLAKEHTQLAEKLADIAKDQKLAILAGTEKTTKEMLDRLAQREGKALDREYLNTIVEEHGKAIQMFETQAKNGTDAKLKDFAETTLPHLKKHLEEAKQLSKDLN